MVKFRSKKNQMKIVMKLCCLCLKWDWLWHIFTCATGKITWYKLCLCNCFWGIFHPLPIHTLFILYKTLKPMPCVTIGKPWKMNSCCSLPCISVLQRYSFHQLYLNVLSIYKWNILMSWYKYAWLKFELRLALLVIISFQLKHIMS